MNQLEQLKSMTTVVADTGDFNTIEAFKPQDTTTNPSLLLKAVSDPANAPIIQGAVELARDETDNKDEQLAAACDYLSVLVGKQLLERIPGRNSTEVDARLSFDTKATVEKAKRLIDLYQQQGIERHRILIKIAATWEGIKAAEILERENIQCNLTLLFNFAQARACAEAGVYLISPFVGRILDWHKAQTGQNEIAIEDDPGVASVTNIFNYYKSRQFETIVMGASFRSRHQVLALAGCDRLTIAPALLQQLADDSTQVQQRLFPATQLLPRDTPITEAEFRWQMNEDAMATEKTAQGIRAFAADQVALEALVADHL